MYGFIEYFLELSSFSDLCVLVCIQSLSVQSLEYDGVKLTHLFKVTAQSTESLFIPVSALYHKVIPVEVDNSLYIAKPFELVMQIPF